MNSFSKLRGAMSKVANDNTIPTNVWLFKFVKVGIVIAILTALFLIFS
ncbi:MAG: hypothetical protein KBD31_00250 [Proteobacteria bacterium]|nr:hypothetical protein [Pseudomonadota bacterium]